MRELQKMPEGVEIKAKVTKGGKGAKKRKADGSVCHVVAVLWVILADE